MADSFQMNPENHAIRQQQPVGKPLTMPAGITRPNANQTRSTAKTTVAY